MTSLTEMTFPSVVLMTSEVSRAMRAAALAEFRRHGTEWGGLLWGSLFSDPAGGLVPIILDAFSGQCRATSTTCEILSESWEADRSLLNDCGRSHLMNLGDWHSHPAMGVFLSGTDQVSFWSHGHVKHWLSIVIDPFREEADVFAKDSPSTYRSVPSFIVPPRLEKRLLPSALDLRPLESTR